MSVEGAESNMLPIGTMDIPFTGEFKGNGHKISGMSINEVLLNDGDEGCAALFGYISGNAYIHDFEISGEVQTNGMYAAGIVSHITKDTTQDAKITRVMSDVDIHSTCT